MVSRVIYVLYRVLLALVSPLVLVYFLARALRTPAYWSTFGERLGFLPPSFQQTASGAIWLHAVSVGEVLAAVELARKLAGCPLFISVGTLAGRRLADQKLSGLVDGIFFAPLDYAWIVRRVLRRIRPSAVVVIETEIWPNLFREAKRAGCGLVVVNGRISDRVWPRYRSLRWFFKHVLQWPDAILAQSETMRSRYAGAGAPAERVRVSGNLKYDVEPGPMAEEVRDFVERTGPASVWIAASTMPPDEEATVVHAFQDLAPRHPGLLLILAPRKPERFDLAADLLREAGIPFVRRTRLDSLRLPGVLLLDSIGELSGLFALADAVFVGGSIVTWGGHNLLEPAIFGKPVVIGRHMQNFQEMSDSFRDAGAVVEVSGAEALPAAVDRLLLDPAEARRIGELGRACAASQRGGTVEAVSAIQDASDAAVPRFLPPLPALIPLWFLERLWMTGARIRRAWMRSRAGTLRAPVISVGNLTMGGAGKTPMVLYLAGKLDHPAILTRGYGRSSTGPLVLAPGKAAPVADTGDEAQLFLRSGLAPVGIGGDRLEVGRSLEHQYTPKVLLADDAFQHARLNRRLDIVLIDSLDPFPPFRLREPMSALARAGIFVITRSEGRKSGIEAILHRHNARAPIFHARVVPVAWVEGATGRRVALDQFRLRDVVAVCGLGNPESFWRTLREMGVTPIRRVAFPDHYRYTLDELPSGVSAVVTTEKDWVKLAELRPAVPVFWLEIRVQVDREGEFLNEVAFLTGVREKA